MLTLLTRLAKVPHGACPDGAIVATVTGEAFFGAELVNAAVVMAITLVVLCWLGGQAP